MKLTKIHEDDRGEQNPNRKVCIDCGTQIYRGSKQCKSCAATIHGKSCEPYDKGFTKNLKNIIRKRDNYTCQICGKTETKKENNFSIHHIDYNKKNSIIENLITLCSSCHSKTNSKRKRAYWSSFLKEKQEKRKEFKKIHSDFRGGIHTLFIPSLVYPEITVFTTKKNRARGGCIHTKNNEYTTIIQGHVKYILGAEKFDCYTGDSLTIPKNTPHYFLSLTDSIVLEWGATPAEKAEKHPEFRAIVEGHNNDTSV